MKRPGQVGRTARSRIRPFPLCIIALSRNASCLHPSFNYSQSAFFGQGKQGLFTCAKDLFIAAMNGKRPQPSERPGQVSKSGVRSLFGPARSASTEERL